MPFEVCAVMHVTQKKHLTKGTKSGGRKMIFWRDGEGGNDFKTKYTPLSYKLQNWEGM